MPDDTPADPDRSEQHDRADQPWVVDDGPRPVMGILRWLAIAFYGYVLLIELILLIGFVCLLFGIEPASWFVDWVYRSVDRAMQPFRGIFSAIEFGTGSTGQVEPAIESSIPFAMIVYGILALAAHDLVEWLGRPRHK